MVGITRSKVIFCFAVLRVLLHSEAWYILKGMTRLSIYMEVIDKQKCCKCKNETNPNSKKTNYFTSSDPHHDMLGGGCQVRVVIENMMGRMENLRTLISGFLGLVILVRWALVTMFLS